MYISVVAEKSWWSVLDLTWYRKRLSGWWRPLENGLNQVSRRRWVRNLQKQLKENITCCLFFVSSLLLAVEFPSRMTRSGSDWNDESCSDLKRSTRRRLNECLSNEKLDERFISSPLSEEKLLYSRPFSSALAASIALSPSVYLTDFPPPLLGTFAAPPQNINRFPSSSEICSSTVLLSEGFWSMCSQRLLGKENRGDLVQLNSQNSISFFLSLSRASSTKTTPWSCSCPLRSTSLSSSGRTCS